MLIAIVAPIVLSGPANGLTDDASAGVVGRALARHRRVRPRHAGPVAGRHPAHAPADRWPRPPSPWASACCSVPRSGSRRGGCASSSLRVLETAVCFPGLLVALISPRSSAPGVGDRGGIGVAASRPSRGSTANLASRVSPRDFVATARLLGVPAPRADAAARAAEHRRAAPRAHRRPRSASRWWRSPALSFIGLGVQSPDYDFGKLLVDALPAIYSRPDQVVGPALMIVLAILAAMLIGDGLAAAADPRAGAAVRRATHARPRPPQVGPAPGSSRWRTCGSTHRAGQGAAARRLLRRSPAARSSGSSASPVSGKSLTAMSLARLLPDSLTAEATRLRVGDLDLLGRRRAGSWPRRSR